MPNKNNFPEPFDETTLRMPDSFPNRRKISRKKDTFYQLVVLILSLGYY
jgi:hypothetical protein